MKSFCKYGFSIVLFLLVTQASSQNLRAYLFYSTFYSPDDGPYVETYLSISGKSLKFGINEQGKYQGIVNITMIFKQNGEILEFKKYDFLSPELTDTTNLDFNFIDQQRFLLPDGTYDFEMIIADKSVEMLPFVVTRPLIIEYPRDKVNVSGIQLIESFTQSSSTSIITKSGYDLVPYVSNYYPEKVDKLTFYAEIYNTEQVLGAADKYLVSYYIESFETANSVAEFIRVKREDTKPVNVLFNEFDIANLPTGNYNLVIEARNKNNEVIASNKIFFQRSNPNVQVNLNDLAAINTENSFVTRMTNRDTLAEFVRSLHPISTQIEKSFAENLVKTGQLVTLQQYFLNFWTTRNNYSPEDEWLKYYEEVKKTNAAFSTKTKKGYESDRGRVYLQYGPPNAIAESYYEPNAYPYEIWHYYQLKNQRNKKFVFYSREIATNDFELIHSDAIGELANNQWQFVIHERGNNPHSVDQENMENHWGSKIDDYYITPR
jgi:GWxTD domain-containing protein